MFTFCADPSFAAAGVHIGVTEAVFPDRSRWDLPAFDRLKERELGALRQQMAGYDRKAVFGEDPYYRYFKKYKKTYPVLQQLESYLLKGRPFPGGEPIYEIAFLTELCTGALLGVHDIERIRGRAELFCPAEKLPFPGIRGGEAHCYPGDVTGRDEEDIIFSLIDLQPDRRTRRAHLYPPGQHPRRLSRVRCPRRQSAEDRRTSGAAHRLRPCAGPGGGDHVPGDITDTIARQDVQKYLYSDIAARRVHRWKDIQVNLHI